MSSDTQTSTLRGRFQWYDLMSTDLPAAVAFYSSITGWGTEVWNATGTPYTMWTNNGKPLGGMMQLPPEVAAKGQRPHWLAYIGSDDVDATTAQAITLGATVFVNPTDIPTVGRFAVLADPSGAAFAIYKPAGPPMGHDGMPAVGEFSWHELTTRDLQQATDFYHALFGWETLSDMDMGAMGTYRIYGAGAMQLGGMMITDPSSPMPPAWLQYIRVPDIREAAERVKAGGGTIIHGPMEVPNGDMILMGIDPQGGAFALHASKAA